MVFAAAQFLFQGDAPGNFRTQPPVDPHHCRQYCHQQQYAGQSVDQQVVPEGPVIEDIADPALLDLADFAGAHVGHDFVEDADQDLLLPRYRHGQLVAVVGFTADIQTVEFELAQAPDARCEVADHRVDFIGGQCLQGRADVGQGHQVQVRVMGAQQFMRRIVLHHGNLQPVEVFQGARLRSALMGQNDDREIQVGAGEGQETLTLRCRHDSRE
ncbi:hypothetical protein D3C81_1336030 [compost metagenome]